MRCPHDSRNKKNIPFEEKFSYVVMRCVLALFQILGIFLASISSAQMIKNLINNQTIGCEAIGFVVGFLGMVVFHWLEEIFMVNIDE